ncbi:hypothetical protein CRG49_008680 [Neisseria sp. N95_16]|uniref:Uncharacterized protein n=1 Tax=Neisseria brasiliensis TaxID=2666100 RepID=A0A5Q3RVW1_9NEIS|nr:MULTISPECIES: hypothetical protein [Neisseria]MRN37228.1 hypothetical protein [Neisseria brasiliensis]PJO09222.1 hypothetical protein CRG49_008680 [Neisseria sp. N95_16]PJO77123.1 hypothetical protein CWC45_12165 [Neisseria sp. N177_16]QGL24239.1 hypothetical protein GJV52_00915 [Neisseria brasiliensis]
MKLRIREVLALMVVGGAVAMGLAVAGEPVAESAPQDVAARMAEAEAERMADLGLIDYTQGDAEVSR